MPEYLYMNIARKIEQLIREQQLSQGQKLPSERKLSEQFSVSRNVIREALKMLTEKGLVQIRSGRGGYIASETHEATTSFEQALYNSKASLLEILEARKVIELAIIPLVVAKATEEDLKELHSIYDKMGMCLESRQNFAEMDQQFHMALGKCTKNKALSILIETFYNIVDRDLFAISQTNPNRSVQAQVEHKGIIDGIENRNSEAVTKSMEAHMSCIQKQIIQLGENLKKMEI
ncbi:MAG: FadR/GntR family transcriptional regulator [Ethanoligenens sp.]